MVINLDLDDWSRKVKQYSLMLGVREVKKPLVRKYNFFITDCVILIFYVNQISHFDFAICYTICYRIFVHWS